MKHTFAIIDIETTGGSARMDKITEIGIVLHDGHQIIKTFSTLINPERSIPPFITGITGITDSMVAGAPKFYEIAKEVIEWTESSIFVAHNARFDYGFIAEEFRQLGYLFSKKTLCTVQMSRRAFPGLKSYSLGNLVKHFGIKLDNHHRALDDARATSEIFEKIVKSDYYTRVNPILSKSSMTEQKLPPHIDAKILDAIPDCCGVYYFLDEAGDFIYIGKSNQLRRRVYEHFSDNTERSAKLAHAVNKIEYTVTGNELAALLLESAEIKQYNPSFNKAQRRKEFKFAICQNGTFDNPEMPVVSSLLKVKENQELLKVFSTQDAAKKYLEYIQRECGLCACVRNQLNQNSCIHLRLGTCKAQEELPDVQDLITQMVTLLRRGFEKDGILVGPGRDTEEQFVAVIQKKQFLGMGYISKDLGFNNETELLDHIRIYAHHPEIPAIVRNYLKDHQDVKFVTMG